MYNTEKMKAISIKTDLSLDMQMHSLAYVCNTDLRQ